MTIMVEATVEKDRLKLKQPINLAEGTEVRVVITPVSDVADPLADVIGVCDGPADGAENHDKYIYGKLWS
jgi:predicted DNA-binding antitoxin AbrB/MazE fold protein